MENSKLVSVVVPVHNVKNYIKNLFGCLEAQKYTEWELILIDDHSADHTISEIDREKENISQHVIIENNHGTGVSAARNTGIEMASGNYIAFIDADDKIQDDYLKILVENMINTRANIVMCSYKEILHGSQRTRLLPWDGCFSSAGVIYGKIIPRLVFPRREEEEVWLPVWRTLINLDFLKRTGVHFNEEVSQAEDFMFLFELLLKTENISFIKSKAPYYYIRRSNSALNSFIENNLERQKMYHEFLFDILNQYGLYKKMQIRYLSNKSSMYSIAISNATRIKEEDCSLDEIRNVRIHYMNDDKLNTFPILRLYNQVSVKMALYLLRLNCVRTLRIIYSIKEKRRLKKLN